MAVIPHSTRLLAIFTVRVDDNLPVCILYSKLNKRIYSISCVNLCLDIHLNLWYNIEKHPGDGHMDIYTTKIIPRRSFPTYQLHAYIKSKTETAENAYKICILETFKWLRARFSNFNETIEELLLPEPEDYSSFSTSSLHSFSINKGFNIEVVYIENKGIWSFCLTEPDMGANTGREDERKAVNGRTFSTNISYRLYADKIEFGLQTLCSQPCDVTEVCEVYRPHLSECWLKTQTSPCSTIFI